MSLESQMADLRSRMAKLEGSPFHHWCEKHKLTDETISLLEREDFGNLEALRDLTSEIMDKLPLKLGNRARLEKALKALNEGDVHSAGSSQVSQAQYDELKQDLASQKALLSEKQEVIDQLKKKMESLQTDAEKQGKNYQTLSNGVTSIVKINTKNNTQYEELSDLIEKQKKQLDDVIKRQSSPQQIGFMGIRRSDCKGTEAAITYDTTLTNFGGGFTGSSGEFKAPVRGLYFFIFHAWQANQRCIIYLYHNGNTVCSAHGAGGDVYSTVSNSCVIQLQAADTVDVRLRSGHYFRSNNENFMTFSGYLIYPLP